MVEPTKETFSGSLAGETLLIRSDAGPSCKGQVRIGAGGYGFGNLSCSDGRFGHFKVSLRGHMGTAYGNLGGKNFTLTIG